MDEKLLNKLVLLNRKLAKKGWYIHNGWIDTGEYYKIFYNDKKRNITVSINTCNGYLKYYIYEYSDALTLAETLIFYKIAAIYRQDLESKIGKRL